MIKKGTFVVRTKEFSRYRNYSATEIYGKVGALFPTIRDSPTRAPYTEVNSISSKGFRLASIEEIRAYKEDGIRNINDMKEPFTNFCVCIGKAVNRVSYNLIMKEYKRVCDKYNIKYSASWGGNVNYYGIQDGTPIYNQFPFGKVFHSVKDFKDYLINKNNNKNETNTIIGTNTRSENRATAISSSKIRQVTSGSRPSGNRIKGRRNDAKISHSKVRFSAVYT